MILLLLLLPRVFSTTVQTYISSHNCPGCQTWTNTINDVQTLFPTLTFETLEFDYENATKNVALPYTVSSDHLYPFPNHKEYLIRWLSDIVQGRETKLVRKVALSDDWTSGFQSWIHILSATDPNTEDDARRLLSTGFAWSSVPTEPDSNIVTFQTMDGEIRMSYNVSDMTSIYRQIFPPIIPFEMSERFSNAIASYFASSIYLVAPSVSISKNDINVACIHVQVDEPEVIERNMSSPSSWLWKRNVEFMLPSVDSTKVLNWYDRIQSGSAEAFHRPSMKKEGDVSSNELWAWVRARKEAILYGYDSPETLESCKSSFQNVSIDVGKIDVRTNDHESFPNWSRGGMFHHYKDGKHIRTNYCSQTEELVQISKEQPITNTDNTEL
jgi:hypothetical protein